MMALDKLENVSKYPPLFDRLASNQDVNNIIYSGDKHLPLQYRRDIDKKNLAAKEFDKIELANQAVNKKEEVVAAAVSNHKMQFLITEDRKLLDQYYYLRNDVFRNEKGWTKSTWFESEHDRHGKIVVAVDEKNKVIGGLRLMTSVNNDHLSDEFPGTEFTYPNLFAKIGLDKNLHYVEIDGAVVNKEHRDRHVMIEMVRVAIDYAKKCGCSYLVGISLPVFCRNYRMVLRSLGYQDVTIVNSFPWKKLEIYNNSIDYPIVSILTSK